MFARRREMDGISVLATVVDGADTKSLRSVADQVRSKFARGVFVVAAVQNEKASVVAGVTSNLTDLMTAEALLRFVVEQANGKGGGRADMAQGAVADIDALPAALDSVYGWVESALK